MTKCHAVRIAPLHIAPILLLSALPALTLSAWAQGTTTNPQLPPTTPSAGPQKPLPKTVAPGTTDPDTDLEATPLPSRLTADSVRYEGGTIIAEGSAERPARFVSGAGEITAHNVRVDTLNRTLKASGGVMLQRTRIDRRRILRSSRLPTRYQREVVTDTLRGQNLEYDFKTRTGSLDHGTVQVAGFDLEVNELTVNGGRYVAQRVVLRPGGQTPAEDKLYGVPPLNIRARELTLIERPDRPPVASVKSAGIYFKNTRLLPIPRAVFGLTRRLGGPREEKAFSLTPSLSFNSVDRVLVTTRLTYPLTKRVQGLAVVADLGASARQTFRGGLSLELDNRFGQLALRGKVKDIVSQQLQTNKFLLDRTPELEYISPDLRLFKLAGRQTGLRFEGSLGTYKERVLEALTGGPGTTIKSSRRTAGIILSTRRPDEYGTTRSGPYLDLFASRARYPTLNLHYDTTGFEVGYDAQVTKKLYGVFSFRHTRINGDTPFLFDEVEIPREVRATFDYRITPRFIIPVDLRYDLDREELRDKSFGLLRAYKNFAYGLVYDSARRDLKLEFRSGF